MKIKYFSKLTIKHSIIIGLFLILGFFPLALFAQSSGYTFVDNSGLNTTGSNAGYTLTVPQPELIVGRVIQFILGLLGIAFLGFMIYAGITWMTAQGNDTKVQRAKDMITEAIVGLIIVVAAYAIAYFVINFFGANAIK